MSYDYSKLNNIIELQYKNKTIKNDYENWWFLEETLKFGKGYVKPSNYLNNVYNKIKETSTALDKITVDEPLYLHI